jgi:5'-methylthioadenosine phosphorylase
MVVRTLNQNAEKANETIINLVDRLPEKADCSCTTALANAIITDPAVVPSDVRSRYGVLVEKYLPS